MVKTENLVKNRKFGQKSKFWSKIKILVKNRNFDQKPIGWSKIENFNRKSKFWLKSKCWLKIKILVKNRIFGQKPTNFFTTIEILVLVKKFWLASSKICTRTIMVKHHVTVFRYRIKNKAH